MAEETKKQEITREISFQDLLEKTGEEGATVLMKHGLHCIGCQMAAFETVEQGCKAHGLSDEQIDEMVKELNKIVKKEE